VRHIAKGQSPDAFEAEKASVVLQNDPAWKNLHGKQALKQQLLEEQQCLCAYCERGIAEHNAHIEHIYPQSIYPSRRFEYTNLIASCNGEACQVELSAMDAMENTDSCGHRKEDAFDETRFLNPVTLTDIGNYFVYDKTTCAILPSDLDPERSAYMIDLLNLDNPRLNNERSNARSALLKVIGSGIQAKARLGYLLAKDRPFISFLRYNYAPLVGQTMFMHGAPQ
jgi:uncharacterized protein (TIGR02646 family)